MGGENRNRQEEKEKSNEQWNIAHNWDSVSSNSRITEKGNNIFSSFSFTSFLMTL